MTVHHVEVDEIRPRLLDRAHFFPQIGEIGGEDGRGDPNRLLHEPLGIRMA